jgi:biopolymer transport protein ExbD
MSSPFPVAEPQLNATPLIDVLLVLLILVIFTLPVMTHNTGVTLPQGPPRRVREPAPIFLDIDFDGAILWNGTRVESIEVLERRLKAEQLKDPAPPVQVRPDLRAPYEYAAQVLAATQRAHVRKLTIQQVADR